MSEQIQLQFAYAENPELCNMQRCPTCNQKVSLRKVVFSKTLLTGGIKLFRKACTEDKNIIHISEAGLNNAEYSRANDLIRFGLAYRDKDMKVGFYGINRKRFYEFLNGDYKIMSCFWVDPTKDRNDPDRRIFSEKRIGIDEVPSVDKVRQEMGERFATYELNPDFL